jgi:hypothetical protein
MVAVAAGAFAYCTFTQYLAAAWSIQDSTSFLQHPPREFGYSKSSPLLPQRRTASPLYDASPSASSEKILRNADGKFSLEFDLPGLGPEKVAVTLTTKPVLSVPSELVMVRRKIPFGLDVEPKKGLAVCSKDGSSSSLNGSYEKVGDVLRFTTQWTLGLPRGVDGLVGVMAQVGGGLSWQCSLFDVMKSKVWEQVVQALTSNTPARTDEVVLIFERTLDGSLPPEVE